MHAIVDAIKTRKPRVLPDAPGLLVQSVGRQGLSLFNKQALDPWVQTLQDYVARNGKWRQFEVVYTPVSPPPGLFEYACVGCRFYQPDNGCSLVEGFIAKSGWCVAWAAPAGAKPLRWPAAMPGHLMQYAKEAPKSLLAWLKGGKGTPATGATTAVTSESLGQQEPPSPKGNPWVEMTTTPAPETPADQVKTLRL